LFGIYSFFVNWLAVLNGDISLLWPFSLISQCYVVFPCLIIVFVWCQKNFTSFHTRDALKWAQGVLQQPDLLFWGANGENGKFLCAGYRGPHLALHPSLHYSFKMRL